MENNGVRTTIVHGDDCTNSIVVNSDIGENATVSLKARMRR